MVLLSPQRWPSLSQGHKGFRCISAPTTARLETGIDTCFPKGQRERVTGSTRERKRQRTEASTQRQDSATEWAQHNTLHEDRGTGWDTLASVPVSIRICKLQFTLDIKRLVPGREFVDPLRVLSICGDFAGDGVLFRFIAGIQGWLGLVAVLL